MARAAHPKSGWQGRSPPTSRRKRPEPPVDLEESMVDGEPRALRRVLEAMRGKEGALVVRDARGALRAITAGDVAEEALVTIVHPIDLSAEERASFASIAGTQPIEQLARAVHVLAPHRAPLTIHPVEEPSARSVRALWRRGWEADFDDDAYDAVAFATERDFPAARLAARLPHSPIYRGGGDILEPIDLDPAEPDGLVFLGEGREPAPLGAVPARIFSEVMRDLLAVQPAPTKKRAAPAMRPIERVDRLFDRLAKSAGNLEVRADVNSAVARLSPDGQRLVALVVQGNIGSDSAIARALDIPPGAADALLDEVEKTLGAAMRR